MDLKEVASLLGMSRQMAKVAIDDGITTHNGSLVRLAAAMLDTGPDVTEQELDAFIASFERDEPGRHPPVGVRRELLIECGYKCAVCKGDAPLDFHHILNWSVLQHHDVNHMLAVCANCHAKISRHGQPDEIAQKEIKRRLRGTNAHLRMLRADAEPSRPGSTTSWLDAREHAQNITNELLRDALIIAAEAGHEQELHQAAVQLAGCYDALRIHWLREYRLAHRSDAPQLEGYLPALLSPAAEAVFPERPWLSQEPKLAEDKHSVGAQAETPFSVSDRREFGQLLDRIDLPRRSTNAQTPPQQEVLRLHGRLVNCILRLEDSEAPILERFGQRPGVSVLRITRR